MKINEYLPQFQNHRQFSYKHILTRHRLVSDTNTHSFIYSILHIYNVRVTIFCLPYKENTLPSKRLTIAHNDWLKYFSDNIDNGIVIKNRSTFDQNCTFAFLYPLQNEDMTCFFPWNKKHKKSC